MSTVTTERSGSWSITLPNYVVRFIRALTFLAYAAAFWLVVAALSAGSK